MLMGHQDLDRFHPSAKTIMWRSILNASQIRPSLEAGLSTNILGWQVNVGAEIVNVRRADGKVILGGRFKDRGSLKQIHAYIDMLEALSE